MQLNSISDVTNNVFATSQHISYTAVLTVPIKEHFSFYIICKVCIENANSIVPAAVSSCCRC